MNEILYKKIVNPFKSSAAGSRYKYQVYFSIEIIKLDGNKYPHCSIYGVHGPTIGGNCMGGCGQIIDDFINEKKIFNKGWNQKKYLQIVEFWKKYHLKNVEENSELFHEIVKMCEIYPDSKNTPAWI